jgi:hypothetical protein
MGVRKHWLLPAIAIAAALLWFGLPPYHERMPPDEQLAAKLQGTLRALNAGATVPATIDLPAIADFDWDRVYVFGAYECPEFIAEKLGFRWDGCEASGTVVQDFFQLVVFVKAKSVVRWFDYAQHVAHFVDTNRPIERVEARAVRVSFPAR